VIGAPLAREQPAPATNRWATVAVCAYGAMVAAALGHFLLGIPIQLTDSYNNIVKLDAPWRELLVGEFHQRSYLRPFLFAELKVVHDLSGGNYFAWYRGTHVAQVFVLVALYLSLVRPRTWRDAAIVPLGLAVLLGSHTFFGTVNEAFPVNTFMTILLCCLAAANLVMLRHRWWVDVLAVTLFVVAALTVETGLLVWVILIGGALVGARGVSRAGLGALTALLAAYFYLRFFYLDVGSPGLIERSSGYGFRVLDPDDLIGIFGANPIGFYLYNVAASAMSVLFSEPRNGVFGVTRALATGAPRPFQIVNVVASTCATLVIAAFIRHRARPWLARRFERDDQLVILFVMVLAANSLISYPYTKDVIMSPAGVFFAVATYAAVRWLVTEWPPRPTLLRSMLIVLCCASLGATWGLRAAGMHLGLRVAGVRVRNDWSYVDDWIAREHRVLPTPRERTLLRDLRHDAIFGHPPLPPLAVVDSGWFDVN
jgi:hypothetical protein